MTSSDLDARFSEQDQRMKDTEATILRSILEMHKQVDEIRGLQEVTDTKVESPVLRDALKAVANILSLGKLYSVTPDVSMQCAGNMLLALLGKAESPKSASEKVSSANPT